MSLFSLKRIADDVKQNESRDYYKLNHIDFPQLKTGGPSAKDYFYIIIIQKHLKALSILNMLQLFSKLQSDQIHKAALASSGLNNDTMMSLLGQ